MSNFDTDPFPPFSNQTTSFEAAKSMSGFAAAEQREHVFLYICRQGEKGATDEEIHLVLGIRQQSATPRRWELRNQGLVKDSGKRRQTTSGRNAIVWVAA